MSYINLTLFVTGPTACYVKQQWTPPVQAPFVKRHLAARGGYAALIPLALITQALDIAAGLALGTAALVTAGQHRPTFATAIDHMESAKLILTLPYGFLLRILNPAAQFPSNPTSLLFKIGSHGEGLLAGPTIEKLECIAQQCASTKSFFKRHVASRLTYALIPCAVLISRIVDGVIGILAATLSLITLGKMGSLNNLAYRGLQAPGIVFDVFYYTIKCINPWANPSS